MPIAPQSRYQSPQTDEYPKLGRLLIALLSVLIGVGIATWAAIRFLA